MESRLKLKKSILKILVIFLLSCNNIDNKAFTSKYYSDFDLFKQKGIYEIKEKLVAQKKTLKKTVYRVVFYRNSLDSIIIMNPYSNSPDMKLKIICNDSVCIYKTSYPYQGHDQFYKSYYVFSNDNATQFTHWEDNDWQVTAIKSDTSYGGAKLIEDTVNFEYRLLRKEIINMKKMPAHRIHKYHVRLNSEFTFNSWLNIKDLAID